MTGKPAITPYAVQEGGRHPMPDKLGGGREVVKRKSKRLPMTSVKCQWNSSCQIKQERHKAHTQLQLSEPIFYNPRDPGVSMFVI